MQALRDACRDRRLCAALDCLLAHDLKQKLRIEELTRRLHLSGNHVRHLFHLEWGRSPAQLFKLWRLEKAHAMFSTEFLSVKEVMAALGFNDRSHFLRDYKRLYGTTPSQLRKALRSSPTENGGDSGTGGLIPMAS